MKNPTPLTLRLYSVVALALAVGLAGCRAPAKGSMPVPVEPTLYPDGRPGAALRMEARDQGVVLRYGDDPGDCDRLGARDVWVWEDGGTYYMHYDGAGAQGWLACLATSRDLVRWEKHGPVLDFGAPGSPDARSASYGVTYREGERWHLFYLGTPNVTPAPDFVPMFPYLTLKAEGDSPRGPWRKRYDVVPFRPRPDSYYASTASPGHVVATDGGWTMFFSASIHAGSITQRTLGLARTQDLDGPWTVDPEPIVPLEEQIENSSLYYEPANDTWFLFTNHIGVDERGEYTDATSRPRSRSRGRAGRSELHLVHRLHRPSQRGSQGRQTRDPVRRARWRQRQPHAAPHRSGLARAAAAAAGVGSRSLAQRRMFESRVLTTTFGF